MKRIYKVLVLTFLIAISFVSCTKDFDEMNKNWKNPTGSDIGPLFNGVISSLILTWNEQFYLNNEIFYPETELGALISDGWGNSSIGTENVWSNYYYALANIRDLEDRMSEYCSQVGDTNVCDMLKAQIIVLKAYKTFKVTDIFGDIPYFNAGRIWQGSTNPDYLRPKFDSQEEIYKTLLKELVWARDLLLSDNTETVLGNKYYSVSSYDPLMWGDLSRWGKFANCLILRHGLRCYEKDPEFASTLLIDAYNNPIIDDMDGVCMWPKKMGFENTAVSWSFREHRNLRMGTTIWGKMSLSDDTTGKDIFDYRAYIFFDTNNGKETQLNMGNWVAFPQIRTSLTPSEGGTPYSTNRDTKYSYKGKGCIYSPFNYYLTRDQYFIPEILMTYADALFMKAEIMALRLVPYNQVELENNLIFEGIYQSFLFWTQMPAGAEIWKYKYPAYANVVDNNDIYSAAYKMASWVNNAILQAHDYNLSDSYFEIIYEQRWINLFRQPWEAWTLTRRTMLTPTTTEHAKLTSYRLEYPPTEIDYNYESYTQQVAKMDNGDSRKTKVWWMTK